MTSDQLRPDEIEYEREDLSAGSIVGFLAGLAIIGLLLHIIVLGMYKYLDRYERTHEPPQNPLVSTPSVDTSKATPEDASKFPLPRLETNERGQLYQLRMKEEETLNSYGWVDQQAGIAHIPIGRAMEIIAQRGLPSTPENMTAGSAAQQRQRSPAAKKAKPAGQAPAPKQ